MEKLNFKKGYKDGLFTFLHVENSSYGSLKALKNQYTDHTFRKGISDVIFMQTFHNYLALSDFLCDKLDKYCLAAHYPEKNNVSLSEVGSTCWSYSLLSDDYNGLSVDKGFLSRDKDLMDKGNSNEQRLYSLESFLSLSKLPEETFGEVVSRCSLFGINDCRITKLQQFIQTSQKPELEKLLEEDDIFIHIVVAKEIGYYNSLLIKSVKDIENTIYAFINVLDPTN